MTLIKFTINIDGNLITIYAETLMDALLRAKEIPIEKCICFHQKEFPTNPALSPSISYDTERCLADCLVCKREKMKGANETNQV